MPALLLLRQEHVNRKHVLKVECDTMLRFLFRLQLIKRHHNENITFKSAILEN